MVEPLDMASLYQACCVRCQDRGRIDGTMPKRRACLPHEDILCLDSIQLDLPTDAELVLDSILELCLLVYQDTCCKEDINHRYRHVLSVVSHIVLCLARKGIKIGEPFRRLDLRDDFIQSWLAINTYIWSMLGKAVEVGPGNPYRTAKTLPEWKRDLFEIALPKPWCVSPS